MPMQVSPCSAVQFPIAIAVSPPSAVALALPMLVADPDPVARAVPAPMHVADDVREASAAQLPTTIISAMCGGCHEGCPAKGECGGGEGGGESTQGGPPGRGVVRATLVDWPGPCPPDASCPP